MMRVPESWKQTFRALTAKSYSPPGEVQDYSPPGEVKDQVGSTVHSTPAGQYPREGPQPHKLPVLAYYLSVVLSIVGVLTLAKCAYLDEADRTENLLLGFSMLGSGLFFLFIANWLYNREFAIFVSYLQGQVEELRKTHTPVSALDRI